MLDERSQARPTHIPHERREDVIALPGLHHPKPAHLPQLLNGGGLHHMAIRSLLINTGVDVAKHNANRTLRVDEHIAEIGSDGYRVLPGHRSGGSLELKVCEEFAMKLDGSFI